MTSVDSRGATRSARTAEYTPHWLDRWPITVRLFTASMLSLLALMSVGIVSVVVMRTQRNDMARVTLMSQALLFVQRADMQHDAIQSRAFASMLDTTHGAARRDALERELEGYRQSIVDVLSLPLPQGLRDDVHSLDPAIANYIYQAESVSHGLAVGTQSSDAMPAVEAAFATLAERHDWLTTRFQDAVVQAERNAASRVRAGMWVIGLTCLLTAVLVGAAGRIVAHSVPRALDRVRDAAHAIAEGDLSIRTNVQVHDEIGDVAQAVNHMADTLQTMIARLQTEQDRDAFSRQLSEVLEMADTEEDTYSVVSRAMSTVSTDMKMELLVSDSSRAHLERAAAHPTNGAAHCSVESPYGCMAVRRGNPVVFDTSDALNACSRLVNRGEGACSAVCVPLTFMGRSIGVLHATAPAAAPPPPRVVSQLTTLGILTGSRIGTVRAFERTQVQASTDSLTGLLNRRSVESRVRRFGANQPYAVILTDLDRFKKLNDTHGHDAGDRALRIFADVLKRSLRGQDLAARWGGEEFLVVLEGHTAFSAFEVAERIRTNLATAVQVEGPLTFTASFGIADSTMGVAFDQLVRVADDALYQSKETGRDRVTVGETLKLGGVPRRDAEHLAAITVEDFDI
ncbi:MAG: diguanylate cyclase [Vicinamibacterales bacterium]